MTDSKAGTPACAHLEAWPNHDLEAARRNLAADLEFASPAAQTWLLNDQGRIRTERIISSSISR